VPVIHDLIPDRGSLGGLYTGLRQASTDHVFVVACDMPFLQPDVVQYVIALKADADVVMAKREGRLQPMHAVYSRSCLPHLEEMVKTRHLKIQDLVTNPTLRVRLITEAELSLIDPEGRSFFNINSPSDLEVGRTLYTRSMDSRSSG
jgi:molybdopterin-guanine dinucleotide biosynthesis protein A